MMATWLSHYLGLTPDPSNVDAIPTVQYYVMGDVDDATAPGNEWRNADDWPLPAAPIRMHLHAGGELLESCPSDSAGSTSYTYDPTDPCPTVGGANLVLPAGPLDQAAVEARSDVAVFSSPVLTEPMEITGRVRAHLWVQTNATDTDIVVRMTDVYPDGRSMLVLDGIQRLGYRDGATSLAAVPAGEPVEVEIDLWSTSIILNAGHQLRISVTSSNAMRFWPNPNDGSTYDDASGAVSAEVFILHDAQHPSFVEVPNPQRPDIDVTTCGEPLADAGTDGAVSDAGADVADDVASGDASQDASGGAANPTTSSDEDDGGCGCRSARRRTDSAGWVSLVLLGLALHRWRSGRPAATQER